MTTFLSPVQDENESKVRGRIVSMSWQHKSPPSHEFAAVACPENDGGYSAFALHYPDVISQGDSLEEVRDNLAEAFLAVMESRRKHGEIMEFTRAPCCDIPKNSKRLWISVDG